ncbi:ABC transporter permease [Sphaerisporangium sp. NPDC049002]|uniref:ABC transporter permease n=1 Tax=unclassified Sphaerisporangium TaxID=2630420 RepID=UPI0033D0727D
MTTPAQKKPLQERAPVRTEPAESSRPAARRNRRAVDPVVLALIPIIVAAMIVGAVVSPAFLTTTNIIDNIITTSAVLGVLVIAESLILISGYFDLSLQSTVGFAPMLLAVLVSSTADNGLGLPFPVAILIAVPAVLLIGLANGFMIAKLKLNAFIVTLAMLILLQGLTIGLSGGQTYAVLPRAMTYLGDGVILGLPVQAWIFVLAFAAAFVFMEYTPTGRSLYAMGGNHEAARAAGIRTTRLTIGVVLAGSVLASVAGLMLTGRIASVTANQGDNLIFTVFAAAVIGGISLNGGRGNLIGAGLGVILLGIIQNILTLSNVPSFWINAAYGAIILAALLIGWLSSHRFSGPRRAE